MFLSRIIIFSVVIIFVCHGNMKGEDQKSKEGTIPNGKSEEVEKPELHINDEVLVYYKKKWTPGVITDVLKAEGKVEAFVDGYERVKRVKMEYVKTLYDSTTGKYYQHTDL